MLPYPSGAEGEFKTSNFYLLINIVSFNLVFFILYTVS